MMMKQVALLLNYPRSPIKSYYVQWSFIHLCICANVYADARKDFIMMHSR